MKEHVLLRGLGRVVTLAAVGAIALALIGVWIAGFGGMNETLLRIGTYTLAAAVLLSISVSTRLSAGRPGWCLYDLLLVMVLAVSVARYFKIGAALETGLYFFQASDIWSGVAGVVLLLELTRRAFGLPLVIVCTLAMVYALLGDSLPWIFRHGGYSLQQVVQVVWYSFDGVFGGPLSVAVTLILVFIIFGSLLEAIGAGPVLLRFAFAATGRMRGAPAHAAIAASGVSERCRVLCRGTWCARAS